MKFSSAAIASLAYSLPPEIWTSAALEAKLAPLYQRLRLPEGRLELMTGIRERRFWPVNFSPSQASAEAGKNLLAQSKVNPNDIDLLMHCAVCRDRLEPATAAYVHQLLGLGPHTQIFDLSNACLGFVNGLAVSAAMIEGGQARRALLVSGENGRPLVERTLARLNDGTLDRQQIKPYFANLTIGAGAVAALVVHQDLAPPNAPRLLASVVETDTSASNLCEGDTAGGGLEMQTDSEALLEAGVEVAARCWTRFQAETGWNEKTPDLAICHQVGKQHQRRLFEKLGLDDAKDFSTFPWLGNIGSVSLPITLARAVEEGRLRPGAKVALLGIGSGLSCQMMALQW
ncbi:MAG TPA: 3-oxoacyl-ACP synthase III [Opitutales bacterium]|nr:3-oxoacyl-ACP synthase III [Opitutales bacterium]